jgi:hypothetical protein
MHTTTKDQTLDQTLKGLVIGVLTWLAMKYSVPVEITVPGMAAVAALMAWLSSRIGADAGTASFVGPRDK